MPRKPLTDKEKQMRTGALARQNMFLGGLTQSQITDMVKQYQANQPPAATTPSVTLDTSTTTTPMTLNNQGQVSTAMDTGVGAQGTTDFLTQTTQAGIPTENSTLQIDQSDLAALNASRDVFGPTATTDLNADGKVDAVDTTGAGDAFNGGLAFGLSKQKPIKECLELANKVAGISTTKLGAGDAMPFIQDIK